MPVIIDGRSTVDSEHNQSLLEKAGLTFRKGERHEGGEVILDCLPQGWRLSNERDYVTARGFEIVNVADQVVAYMLETDAYGLELFVSYTMRLAH